MATRDDAALGIAMRVLLASDGSSFSDPPLRAMLNRPWPAGSMIRVLTVMETPLPVSPEVAVATNFVEEQTARLQKNAEATVEDARESLTKRFAMTTRAHEIVVPAGDGITLAGTLSLPEGARHHAR